MIIGIDVSSIPYGTGVSNYTQNLVDHLLKIDKKNQYKLFYSSYRQPIPTSISKLAKLPNVKIYHYRLPPTLLEFLWNRLHLVPIESFIGQCDIFHTWDWTQPPTKQAKTITTVHDFVPLLFPETQHPTTIAVFKRKLNLANRECHHFICVSRNTQTDLIRLYPHIPLDRISVVYESAENKYENFHKLSLKKKQLKMSVILKQYGLKKYILAQGTREPRKNLDRLIQAFSIYKKLNPSSKVELAISGKYGWGDDLKINPSVGIKILGYIAEKDMVALHACAICLVYPSLYEGFGLPVIKSMKVGTPVITSNTSSLSEITGKAAVLIDPTDVNQIAEALGKVIKSSSLRQTLRQKGLKQSQNFSWQKTAQQTLEIYERLFN